MRTLDPCALHGDYVWTLSSSPSWPKKARVVGRYSHSDNQCTTNIEKEDTPEDTADGFNDVATRAFGFGSGAILE